MEIRQLRYFVALAQELSFTKAALRANVAQPALSRQIRKLEDELGTALVDRTSRRVQLTAAGQRLRASAIQLLDDLERARDDILEITDLSSGRLAIGTTQTPGPLNIARLLSRYHESYPGIEVSVREELSVTIAERLRVDELDLGFVSEIPESARHGLELRLIAAEPLVVAMPPDHDLASEGDIDFGQLRNEPFILFPESATIRSSFDRLADRHGIDPHVAFVTTDTDRMLELVGLGLGIGLLPESDARRPGHDHISARVRGRPLMYTVYLARRASRRQSPSAIAMAALVDQTYTRTL
jgi:DNA-binding transcriptional LysR family regulator